MFFKSLINILLINMVFGKSEKPNIVIITADDLGWNDVSFHGSNQILTPNIDALAYNGVILNRFYTPPLCTPSRCSMMTGKYSNKIGMQHSVILNDSPFGLSPKEKIMPQYFKEAGYETHLIGKWHLGFYQKQYTPTMRGYDSFFGYYGGYIDYYDYTLEMMDRNYSRGYDMRKNLSSNYDIPSRTYATDLFTEEAVKIIKKHDDDNPLFLMINHLAAHAANEDDPMQTPPSGLESFRHIKDWKRRTLAAMVSKLDESVGKVMEALEDADILDNTIVMFYSDNGAPTRGIHSTSGSNHPFKGQKESGWEGAVRNIAVFYSPLLKNKQRVSDELVHITDILPTLGARAGFVIAEKIDGINQWDTISDEGSSKRKEVLHVTDPIDNYSSYMLDEWKLVNGSSFKGEHDEWLGDPGERVLSDGEYLKQILSSQVQSTVKIFNVSISNETILNLRQKATVKCSENETLHYLWENYTCNPLESPCLFNVKDDPCERLNLANVYPDILKNLQRNLQLHISQSVPPRYKSADSKCDPKNFNRTWTWWQPDSSGAITQYKFSLIIMIFSVISVANFI